MKHTLRITIQSSEKIEVRESNIILLDDDDGSIFSAQRLLAAAARFFCMYCKNALMFLRCTYTLTNKNRWASEM
jgi:hypothetical protein